MRVLAAGDNFITSQLLATAAHGALRAADPSLDVEVVRWDSDWPDVAFGDTAGVREAAGDPGELAALAADEHVDVVLTHLAPITAQVLAAPTLRVVGVTRGGPVNVDLAAATTRGIPVCYLPGRNLEAVAEYTVGLMIALPRSIVAAAGELAGGTWDAKYFRFDRTGTQLDSCTVGLVGLGAVGRRVGQLLAAFGTHVIGYDPFADAASLDPAIELVPLDRLLADSDIVSVHARLGDDTRRMFDAETFAAMRRGAYFVNTARGELVDRSALLAALENGHLGGAALDVFDPEPPAADDPLLQRPDVIATPHLAGASTQVATESARRVAEEVAHFLTTGELEHCANPDWRSARR